MFRASWCGIRFTRPICQVLLQDTDVDRRFSGAVPNWTNGLATPNLGDEFFNDNVARCDDEVFYRVRLQDNSGCESVSAIANQVLVKSAGPSPMSFSAISVNKDFGHTELFWDQHPEPETIGYIIFYVDRKWFKQ